MYLAVVVSAILVCLSGTSFLAEILGQDFGTYLRLGALLLFLRQGTRIIRSTLLGYNLEHFSEILNGINKITFLIVSVTLAYFNYGVVGVVIGHIAGKIVSLSTGLVLLFTKTNIKIDLDPFPNNVPIKKLLTYNSWTIILVILLTSLYQFDIILLRILTDSSTTGIYKASLQISEFLWFVPMAVQLVLLHSTSEMWSEGSVEQISKVVSRVTELNLSFTLLLAIGLAVLSESFIPIYFGPDFKASIIPTLLLIPGAIGFAIARPLIAVGQGKGQLKILVLATGAAAVLNLLLNLILIPKYGMAGAAVATSISYGSMALLHIIAGKRLGYSAIEGVRFFRIFIASGLLLVFLLVARMFIPSGVISLVLLPPLGFVFYLVIVVWLDIIPINDVYEFTTKSKKFLYTWANS
jgi:O-antigen/teichoic acid export membrane protein